MEMIPPGEVAFHPHSFADPDGRVFRWRDRLYRGLTARGASRLRDLLDRGILQPLMDRGLLIDTVPTSLRLPGYDLVVEHRQIPFVTYPHEWCPAMFKQATLILLELAKELAGAGMTLKDGHPWNILFDGTRPVYVDIGSIVPMNGPAFWPGREEFHRFCFNPLHLMSYGFDRIARRLLPTEEGVSQTEALAFRPPEKSKVKGGSERIRTGLRKIAEGLGRKFGRSKGRSQPLTQELQLLYETVLDLPLEEFEVHNGPSGSRLTTGLGTPGQLLQGGALRRFIQRFEPRTLLAAGGPGLEALVLPPPGKGLVVTLDSDVRATTHLYAAARRSGAPILPLVMDVGKPTPAIGWGEHWAMAATKRLRCQMVVLAGLLPELVLRRGFTFPQIVEGLASFSSKWAVIEWCDEGDAEGPGPGLRPDWFTCEALVCQLRARFRDVQLFSDHEAPGRVMVCER